MKTLTLTHLTRRCATRALLPLTLLLTACSADGPSDRDAENAPDEPDDSSSDDAGGEGGDDDPGDGSGATMREVGSQFAVTAARGTALGGNATGVHGCVDGQGRYDHYEQAPSAGAAQLHVVGVYSSDEGLDDPEGKGDVDVRVTRPGSSILVLSAYEPTSWNVAVDPGVEITRVVVTGYGAQSATVPDGVPVDIMSPEQTGDVLGGVAHDWPSYTTTDLVDAAEELTGATLTSFRGCYGSASFQIDEPGELEPPHPVSDNPDPTLPPGCEHLASESTYCVTMSYGGVSAVGLDSGTVCDPGVPTELIPEDASSLGWQGDYIYFCSYERGIARVSVVDGTVDIAPIPCAMATGHDGGLLARVGLPDTEDPFGLLAQFADFDHAARREPEHIFALDPYASRIAVKGNQAYFAWHSTNTVETAELADGAPIRSIPLEGFDNWIMGMDVTDSGQLAIGSWFDTEGLYMFDAETGAAQGVVPSDWPAVAAGGLKCTSGGRD